MESIPDPYKQDFESSSSSRSSLSSALDAAIASSETSSSESSSPSIESSSPEPEISITETSAPSVETAPEQVRQTPTKQSAQQTQTTPKAKPKTVPQPNKAVKPSTVANNAPVQTTPAPKPTVAPEIAALAQPLAHIPELGASPERPFDEEIDGIKAPPGVNPQALKQLRDVASKYKGEVAAIKPQFTQLQTEVATLKQQVGKLPEPIERELNDLRAHRVLYDVQNDPTFKAAFDDKIDYTQNQIYDHLKACKMPDTEIEFIKQNGGILNCPDPNNPKELLINSKWWSDNVRNLMNFTDGVKHDDMMKAALQIKGNRDATLENIKVQRNDFEKTRLQEAQKAYQADMNVAKNMVDGLRKQAPWAMVQEIPATATAEVRAQIEADNAFVPELEKRFNEAFDAFEERNISKRTQLAATYAMAYKQMEMLKQNRQVVERQSQAITGYVTEIQRLQGELQKIRSAGKTTSSSPVAKASGGAPKPINEQDYSNMSARQAITARLDALGA